MNPASLPVGRRGQALALAMALAFLGAIWVCIAQPLLSLYQGRADLLVRQEAMRDRMEALAASLPALTEAARKQPETRVGLLSGASDALAAVGLQETVQRLATTTGITLTATEILPPEQDGRFHKIALRISLTASWPALMQMLQGLDQAPVRIFIDDLHLHAPTVLTRQAAPPVQTSLVVYGFSEPPAQPARTEPRT